MLATPPTPKVTASGMAENATYIQGLKNGEPHAYEQLAEQFEGRLYRFFLCNHRDHHVAEEQTAETFAQLVRALPTMRGGPEKLPAFVFSIARHVRSRGWKTHRAAERSQEAALEVEDSQPAPDSQQENRDELEKVLHAIGQLEPTVRDVFLLRFVEEFSIQNVADALGLPIGTVKSHIHRGRARLKEILSKSECQT
jgi:RNA polymerase sigma-70 factor, ECF subfamily